MDSGTVGSSDPWDGSSGGANADGGNSSRVQVSDDRCLPSTDGSTSEGESVAAASDGRTPTGAVDGEPAENEEPPQEAEGDPPKKKTMTKEGSQTGGEAQNIHDVRWDNMFAHLEAFFEEHGDTNVPGPQRGGKEKGEHDYLFRWSERNREQYRLYTARRKSPITLYRIAKLRSLNFCFDKSGDKWRAMYDRLKRFKDANGHCNPNAKNADTKELKDLTRWVQGQRAVFASFAAGRSREDATMLRPKIQLLRELGVEFHAVAQASWEDHLRTLKRRIAERDDGVAPKDSFLKDEEKEVFFNWMNEQRGSYRAAVAGKTGEGDGAALHGMTVERLAKLIDAGMDFNPVETRRREAKIRAEATKAAEEAAPAPAWTAEAVRAFAAGAEEAAPAWTTEAVRAFAASAEGASAEAEAALLTPKASSSGAEVSTDAPSGEPSSGSPSAAPTSTAATMITRDTVIPGGLRTAIPGVLLPANPQYQKYLSETLAVAEAALASAEAALLTLKASSSSAAAATDAPLGEPSSVSLITRNTAIPGGQRAPSGVLLLANPDDRKYLSETLAVVRENVEVFTVTERDVVTPPFGRKCPVVVGLVGLRCVHCRRSEINAGAQPRTRRAVCYPSSVKALYRTVVDMKADHFTACRSVPLEIKEKLAALKAGNDKSKNATLQYFVKAATKMGMADGPNGVTYSEPSGNQIDTPAPSEGMPTKRHPSTRPPGSTRKRKRKASVKDTSDSNEVGDDMTAPAEGRVAANASPGKKRTPAKAKEDKSAAAATPKAAKKVAPAKKKAVATRPKANGESPKRKRARPKKLPTQLKPPKEEGKPDETA